jgi:Rrf2 family protein
VFSVPTKTQYGIRALVHLARAESGSGDRALATSADIAAAESISPKYLEGIMTQLKTAGIVLAERGKGGGFRLARDPSLIRMLDVVEALEGEIQPVGCIENSSTCAQEEGCLPRRFWIGLKAAIDDYLTSKTLKDVIEAL